MLPAVERQPTRQPHQLPGSGMQPPPDRIVVTALVKQAQHVPQIGADQRQQRLAAELVVHPAQPADDVVEVIDDPDWQW
ncbi:MAG: hypothetical protein ACRDTD_11965 [Pseudonocardiaceae bacterium]